MTDELKEIISLRNYQDKVYTVKKTGWLLGRTHTLYYQDTPVQKVTGDGVFLAECLNAAYLAGKTEQIASRLVQDQYLTDDKILEVVQLKHLYDVSGNYITYNQAPLIQHKCGSIETALRLAELMTTANREGRLSAMIRMPQTKLDTYVKSEKVPLKVLQHGRTGEFNKLSQAEIVVWNKLAKAFPEFGTPCIQKDFEI